MISKINEQYTYVELVVLNPFRQQKFMAMRKNPEAETNGRSLVFSSPRPTPCKQCLPNYQQLESVVAAASASKLVLFWLATGFTFVGTTIAIGFAGILVILLPMLLIVCETSMNLFRCCCLVILFCTLFCFIVVVVLHMSFAALFLFRCRERVDDKLLNSFYVPFPPLVTKPSTGLVRVRPTNVKSDVHIVCLDVVIVVATAIAGDGLDGIIVVGLNVK